VHTEWLGQFSLLRCALTSVTLSSPLISRQKASQGYAVLPRDRGHGISVQIGQPDNRQLLLSCPALPGFSDDNHLETNLLTPRHQDHQDAGNFGH